MRGWKAVASLALILAAASLLFTVLLVGRQGRESTRTTNALCALRGDLQQRVQSSQTFLLKHPHGAFGFTPAQIREGQRNQQRTIAALHGLSCS